MWLRVVLAQLGFLTCLIVKIPWGVYGNSCFPSPTPGLLNPGSWGICVFNQHL